MEVPKQSDVWRSKLPTKEEVSRQIHLDLNREQFSDSAHRKETEDMVRNVAMANIDNRDRIIKQEEDKAKEKAERIGWKYKKLMGS